MALKLTLALALFAVVAGCANEPSHRVPPPGFAGPNVGAPPVVVSSATPARPAPSRVTPAPAAQPQPWGWKPNTPARPWKWIVVHHSATPAGGAAAFDKLHKDKGWDELGYHFVIGNGTDTTDGQIEVGGRWLKQKHGAHAKTADNRFNDYGIGICLVGDFSRTRPTPAQMQSLARLTAYLMRTYQVRPNSVIGHSDTKPTECPGLNMNLALARRMAMQLLQQKPAMASEADPGPDAELLVAHAPRP